VCLNSPACFRHYLFACTLTKRKEKFWCDDEDNCRHLADEEGRAAEAVVIFVLRASPSFRNALCVPMQRAVGLPPPPPRSEASSRSKVGALLASAKRARSHKHLVGSTPSLRSQSETRGAVSSSSTGALNSRLSRGRLTSTYVYFLLLEGSWLRCLGLATSVYGLAICVCSALAAPLTLCNVNREFEMDAGYHDETPQIELALRFAAAHVVTMSGGPVVPVTSVGYLTQVFQQLVGVAVNLLVLSAIGTYFPSTAFRLRDCAYHTPTVYSTHHDRLTLSC
jgi:hypothetical protein